MKLYTHAQLKQLLRNGADPETDHVPVVRWFNPTGRGTWLITCINPENRDMAFGLADLGIGMPELGWIYVPELRDFRGHGQLGIERDLHFTATATLTAYANAACSNGYITTVPRLIGVEEFHSGS